MVVIFNPKQLLTETKNKFLAISLWVFLSKCGHGFSVVFCWAAAKMFLTESPFLQWIISRFWNPYGAGKCYLCHKTHTLCVIQELWSLSIHAVICTWCKFLKKSPCVTLDGRVMTHINKSMSFLMGQWEILSSIGAWQISKFLIYRICNLCIHR